MKKFGASTVSRKALLGGTALVAVGMALAAVSVTGYAANVSTDSTWRGTGGGNLNNAAENSNITFTNGSSNVTVTITGTNNLPPAVNGTTTTEVGDITSNAINANNNNKALLTIQNNPTSNTALTVKIKSVNINDNMTVSARGGANSTNNGRKLTVNVTGTTEVKNLTIRNLTSNSASSGRISAVETTLNGNTTVNLTTNVTGGDSNSTVGTLNSGVEGATATLNLKGANNTFHGAVTVAGGANNAANKATLNLYGASTDFKNGVTLRDSSASGAGQALLNVKGNVDQTIKGDIVGEAGLITGNGTLTINNGSNTATFTGKIGGTISSANRLALVQVGAGSSTSTGANAVFEQEVNATKFEINASPGAVHNASATFKGDLTVTDTTNGLMLNDNATGTGSKPIAIFDGTGNQTVNAKITVVNDATGVVKIQNTAATVGRTVTFQKQIGIFTSSGSSELLGEMEIVSGATAEFAQNAYINTVKGGGTIKLSDGKSLLFKDSFGSAASPMTLSVGANNRANLFAAADKTAYTNITLGGANATLNLMSGTGTLGALSVTGNVTTNTDGEGILSITGVTGKTTKITGNIGADGKALEKLDLGGYTSNITGDVHAKTILFSQGTATTIVTFGGNVTAETSFKFDDPGHSAIFQGTRNQTVNGAITANSYGDGKIIVSNNKGTVTFNDKIGEGGTSGKILGSVFLNANTKTVFKDTVHTNDLSSRGMITFNKAGSSVGNNLLLQGGTKITLGNGIKNGQTVINLESQITDLKGKNIEVNMLSSLKNGQSIKFLKGNGVTNAKFNDNSFKIKNTALFSYTAKLDNTTKEYTITAKKNITAKVASTLGVKTSSAQALGSANTAVLNLGPVADSANKAVSIGDKIAFTALNKALNTGGAEAKKAAEQLNIQADMLDAGATAAVGTGTQVMSVASSRLAALRTGVQYAGTDRGGFQTGFAGGDEALSKATWLKPFGSWVKQDAKGDVAGYTADTGGIALGIDAEVTDGVRLGASFAYSKTNVTGKGAGRTRTNVRSYQWTVYADHTADDFYVEGMLGYAVNSSKSSRRLTFGGLNRAAKGDYDSTQYMAGVGGGMPMQVKTDVFVTPMAGLSYTRVSSDSYTETGAGNLNLKVKPDDVDVLIASLGARAHTHIKQGDGILVPSARAGLSYDFMADQATATGRYTGGGAAFKVKGMKAEKLAGNFGLGLAYDDGAWSVGANYDAEVKSGYTGHSASLEARVKF